MRELDGIDRGGCAAGERLNHWQRRWRDGSQREATAMTTATPAMMAMIAQMAMLIAATIVAMTAMMKPATATLAMTAMTARRGLNAMAMTVAAMATQLAAIWAKLAMANHLERQDSSLQMSIYCQHGAGNR
jgi:hypothetical protein